MAVARISPLRLWLQSTSLLAVLAGYCLMLWYSQLLSTFERNRSHQVLIDQVLFDVRGRARSAAQLQALLKTGLSPGLRLHIEQARDASAAGLAAAPRLQGEWLISRALLPFPDGSAVVLVIAQNVAGSIQLQRFWFLLLLVGAGLSSLFTSGLLRLVLRRGLVLPLREFTAQVQAIQLPPTPDGSIDVAAQPEELQPIATAFNAMQQRLWASWERQRIFTDGVAHELRTPITLISGHAQSLLRQEWSQAPTSALALIRDEADRMSSLVSDLLDLARQDAGRLQLHRLPIDADDALLALYERMVVRSAGRLRLAPAAGDDPPLGIGDPDRLQQCLTALVDNALRYCPAGTPITLAGSRAADGSLVLHVRDQGDGVPAVERERIFERFVRGSAALQGEARGSGIGLSVVKLLMQAMGGDVRVEDAPGGGADFQLRLQPFQSSPQPLSPSAPPV
jgi:signal transduction histidine kinase